MPQSIPPGLKREHVLKALADLASGAEHPFGPPTGYELVHESNRFAPKAVVGLAFRHASGRILQPEEFSGGEAPGQANHVLRQLGFTVVKKGESVADDSGKLAGKDWSGGECRLIVVDYFAMLEEELLGKDYSKTEHRRKLSPRLPGRSDGSIEFKHQNVSAVLTGLGLPYVEGYKPRGNYQALLAQEVEAFLDERPGFLEKLAAAPTVNPAEVTAPVDADLTSIREEPPDQIVPPSEPAKPWLSRKGRRLDFALRDAMNRQLGKLGEELVVRFEQQRLRQAGRDDLAAKVEWVAETVGDGLGFDVLSFEVPDGVEAERLVEVKATGRGKFFPFYVTATELRCSEDVPDKFRLYRVFDLSRSPRLYVLAGELSERCRLEPVQYRATV